MRLKINVIRVEKRSGETSKLNNQPAVRVIRLIRSSIIKAQKNRNTVAIPEIGQVCKHSCQEFIFMLFKCPDQE